MRLTSHEDITSIRIQLNELKSKFDRSIREGESFVNVKEIYLQIKELECYLTAMDWNPAINNRTNGSSQSEEIRYAQLRGKRDTSYSHIEETPPLL